METVFPSMIPNWDIEHHNINIETSLASPKIIQACILLSDKQTYLITPS